jgi:hypothetical protein
MPAIYDDPNEYSEPQNSEFPTLESKHKSLIFWDWDDTLLCSSFLSSEGYRLDTDMSGADNELMRQLKDLEESVIKVLETSLLKGEVIIVTNAETNWVQLSAQKFVPGVVPLLGKMQVISARSTYEGMFPNAPLKWKYCAFQDRLGDILQMVDVEKHIISFGDSHVEREAIRAVTKNSQNTKTKSIKFAERPTIEQLQRQVELATKQFHYIHSHDGDLDLCMSLSMVPTGQANSPVPDPQKVDEKVFNEDDTKGNEGYDANGLVDPNAVHNAAHNGNGAPNSPSKTASDKNGAASCGSHNLINPKNGEVNQEVAAEAS